MRWAQVGIKVCHFWVYSNSIELFKNIEKGNVKPKCSGMYKSIKRVVGTYIHCCGWFNGNDVFMIKIK